MSYIDGRNVPGSRSPYTVWLRSGVGTVVGMDYRTLNKYIDTYNKRGYYRMFDFWPWLSYEEFPDTDAVTGFSAVWNEHNVNMSQVKPIK